MTAAVAELKRDQAGDGRPPRAVPVPGVEVRPPPEREYSHEEGPVGGFMAFEESWVESRDVDLTQCLVVGMEGDRMEPVLPAGALLLVDRRRRRLREGRIFVVRRGPRAPLVVKRVVREDGDLTLVADNHRERQPVKWEPHGGEVIGEVVWATDVERAW